MKKEGIHLIPSSVRNCVYMEKILVSAVKVCKHRCKIQRFEWKQSFSWNKNPSSNTKYNNIHLQQFPNRTADKVIERSDRRATRLNGPTEL